MTAPCDSCGDEVDDLVTVQRIYVQPTVSPLEADAAIERGDDDIVRAGDIERWCFPCRTMYPHEVIVDEA